MRPNTCRHWQYEWPFVHILAMATDRSSTKAKPFCTPENFHSYSPNIRPTACHTPVGTARCAVRASRRDALCGEQRNVRGIGILLKLRVTLIWRILFQNTPQRAVRRAPPGHRSAMTLPAYGQMMRPNTCRHWQYEWPFVHILAMATDRGLTKAFGVLENFHSSSPNIRPTACHTPVGTARCAVRASRRAMPFVANKDVMARNPFKSCGVISIWKILFQNTPQRAVRCAPPGHRSAMTLPAYGHM